MNNYYSCMRDGWEMIDRRGQTVSVSIVADGSIALIVHDSLTPLSISETKELRRALKRHMKAARKHQAKIVRYRQ